ncbi:MAG: TspO/MBR family protein [Pseudomonadota bacterium]
MKKYFSLLLWIIVYLAVSFGIGQLTQSEIDGWYAALEKPSLNPPNEIFPIVWTILYIMIASAGWRVWNSQNGVRELKWIFIAYTVLNWGWTPVFFGGHELFFALIWIIILNIWAVAFIVKAWNKERIAAWLMIPPFLWTSFATYLNYSIWMLNV